MNFPLPSPYKTQPAPRIKYVSVPELVHIYTRLSRVPAARYEFDFDRPVSPFVTNPRRIVMSVCGQNLSGKTAATALEITDYLQNSKKEFRSTFRRSNAKKKVLIWDENDEYFQYFPDCKIAMNGIRKWMESDQEIGIIVPRAALTSRRVAIVSDILKDFNNGLLVLEGGQMGQSDVSGILSSTNRSHNIDLIVVAGIWMMPRLMQNSSIIRLHGDYKGLTKQFQQAGDYPGMYGSAISTNVINGRNGQSHPYCYIDMETRMIITVKYNLVVS